MATSPDQELNRTDRGDEMQSRVRYQAKYIAWKSLAMLSEESEIASLFCEHQEDVLFELKRGGFFGVQVKTKAAHLAPFGASEEPIRASINRFIELSYTYPNFFAGFAIASNHGFYCTEEARSPSFLIKQARDGSAKATKVLRTYIGNLNKALTVSQSVEGLIDVLKILRLEQDLPVYADFETVIAVEIGKRPEYALAPIQVLINAANVLINKVQSMSSLEVPRLVEAIFKANPKEYEKNEIISSKRLTPDMVHAVLKSSIIPTQYDAPSISQELSPEFSLRADAIERIKKSFETHSRQMLEWPTTLDGSTRIESEFLESLLNSVTNQSCGVHLILGPPGAGKSALLAVLAENVQAAGGVMLALKADQLFADINNEKKLQEFLDLDYPLEVCIKALAKQDKVVLIFDQLDALSDLTCLDPQRLILLLRQIEKLSQTENVHVIASSRVFDASHDPHLRSIDASRVVLKLPEWEEVSPILDARAINYAAWTDDVKMLLRTPQYLKIFLEIHSAEPGSAFQSYRGLLNTLWRIRVENSDGDREKLLEILAGRMCKFEELTAPSAAFSNYRSSIDILKSANILQEDCINGTLTFSHQTLFEYARARTFLKGNESLLEYVSQRQNSLFIRPQLWNILTYMREDDKGQYRQEVSSVFRSEDLRFHIRLLLMEFVGQISAPHDYEFAWFLPHLADAKFRPILLRAVVRSPGWFQKLADVFLPGFMISSIDNAREVILLLREAMNFNQAVVVDLVESNWLPNGEFDYQTLSVLEVIPSWSARTLKLASVILGRTEVSSYGVNQLCRSALGTSSKYAADLLLAQLNAVTNRIRILDSLHDLALKEGSDEGESEYKDWKLDHNCPRRKALIELLDKHDFYIVDDLIDNDPEIFVETLWPWFIDVLNQVIHQQVKLANVFPGDGSNSEFSAEDHAANKYSIIRAMDDAVSTFAAAKPKRFCEFVERQKHINSLTVQRLIARGLASIVSVQPIVAFEFLTTDDRRLCLGSTFGQHEDSSRLIEALYVHLNADQREVLFNKIKGYSHYPNKHLDDDTKAKFDRAKWDRLHRLELLQAIPKEHASKGVSKFRSEEERAFPDVEKRKHRPFEVVTIGSPLSLDQMQLASVEDLLSLFRQLNDSTGDTHPKDFLKGGTVQLSEKLIELAKLDLEKVLELLKRFDPNVNAIAATRALQGVNAAGLDAESLFQLIRDLDKRGFREKYFRVTVASLVGHQATSGIAVPKDIVDLAISYFDEHPGGTPITFNESSEKSHDSLLWNRNPGLAYSLESSTFIFVEALTDVYLSSNPIKWEEWTSLLERLLKRTDLKDYVSTWQLVALKLLEKLRFADHDRGSLLLTSLLNLPSSPLLSNTGVFLFARAHGWLSEKLVSIWLKKFMQTTWTRGSQAFGELLVLHHIWFPSRTWAKSALDKLFNAPCETKNHEALIGVAHTVGRLWSLPAQRKLKTDLMFDLIGLEKYELFQPICSGLSYGSFPVDEYTKRLFDELQVNQKLLESIGPIGLIDNIRELAEWYPENAYKLCDAFLTHFGTQIGDYSTHYAVIASDLTDLVMRLQHLDEPAKSWGLELFEKMIELKIPDARAMLDTLDRRVDGPTPNKNQARSSRLRRNRKRNLS